MDDIEIPESNDIEWERDMLRELEERLEEVELQIADGQDSEHIDRAQKIVEAMREYAGY